MTANPFHEVDVGSAPLAAARRQRAELLNMIHGFERALAGPVADPAWRERVCQRLGEMRTAFADHVTITEGDHGLYRELLDTAPRLARPVSRLIRDHEFITAQIDVLVAHAPSADPAAIRAHSADLLRDLSRHRQRGADLVYEAYSTDIGGET